MKQETESRGHNFGNARKRYAFEFNGELLRLTLIQITAANGILNEHGATRAELTERIKAIAESEEGQNPDRNIPSLVSNTVMGLRTVFKGKGYYIHETIVPNPNVAKNGQKRMHTLYEITSQPTKPTPETGLASKPREPVDKFADRKRRAANENATKPPTPPSEISAEEIINMRLQLALPSDRAVVAPILETSYTNPISEGDWVAKIQGHELPIKIGRTHVGWMLQVASELGIHIREKEMPDGKRGYYRA